MNCTKTAYRDLGAIHRHLSRLRPNHKKTSRRELCQGSYWCEECQAYHLIYSSTRRGKKP